MAVVLDSKQANTGDGVDDPSWSFTPSGTPTLITVHVSSSRAATLDAVSYGGNAMTSVVAAANGTRKVAIWKLESPPSGTQTVQLTTSASNFDYVAETVAWTGTAASSATSGPQSSTGTGTSTSTAAVSSASGDMVVDTVVADDPGTFTVGAGQTSQWASVASGNLTGGAGSTEPGAASITMSWSWTNSGPWAHVAVNIVQAVAGGNRQRYGLPLVGVT